jgi:uncharacterized Zn finger protein (UPF0148 family)
MPPAAVGLSAGGAERVPKMIRIVCTHCHVPFLRVTAAEDGEEVVCPHCGRPFVPDEEEWVDPEDE